MFVETISMVESLDIHTIVYFLIVSILREITLNTRLYMFQVCLRLSFKVFHNFQKLVVRIWLVFEFMFDLSYNQGREFERQIKKLSGTQTSSRYCRASSTCSCRAPIVGGGGTVDPGRRTGCCFCWDSNICRCRCVCMFGSCCLGCWSCRPGTGWLWAGGKFATGCCG